MSSQIIVSLEDWAAFLSWSKMRNTLRSTIIFFLWLCESNLCECLWTISKQLSTVENKRNKLGSYIYEELKDSCFIWIKLVSRHSVIFSECENIPPWMVTFSVGLWKILLSPWINVHNFIIAFCGEEIHTFPGQPQIHQMARDFVN